MHTKQHTRSIDGILAHLNIGQLNEMQEAAVKAAKTHSNLVLISPTGSGKTIAYLLPIVAALDDKSKQTQAIIIVPSRELVQQIESVFKSMKTGFKITGCYGGHARETEDHNLVQPPAVLVGTPGRLTDHIRRGNITAGAIHTLVLDEFDKSLELGFEEEMKFIIESLPAIKKRVLTSATEAIEIPAFVGLASPERLAFMPDTPGDTKKLEVKIVHSELKDKSETLFRLICFLGGQSTIVFCNHREAVERTSQLLTEKGIVNECYHGGMEQQERESALCKFRNGSTNVLVTTDLGARGLDIVHVKYIVHYHLPHTEDAYIHRNGRTARMDATGTAILILSSGEELPAYITDHPEEIVLPVESELPAEPTWTTLFIAAGKKDKVNKIDVAGFLSKKGLLDKEDIGLIEIKDFCAFVAINKAKSRSVLSRIRDEKIKNQKVKIEIAR